MAAHRHVSMDEAIASIEGALRGGNALHTFRSGGGLQVARLEKTKPGSRRGDKLTGYGEHPHVGEALRHAGEDFAAGGRPYSEVYGTFDMDDPKGGKEGIYPMYLTGTHDEEDRLDRWCKQGTLDARTEDGRIRVDLRGWGEHRLPKDIQARATDGRETVVWEDSRGYRFETSPMTFPGNGEPGCSTRVVSQPEGMKEHRAWIWHTVQTGYGDTFTEALNRAFEARAEATDED